MLCRVHREYANDDERSTQNIFWTSMRFGRSFCFYVRPSVRLGVFLLFIIGMCGTIFTEHSVPLHYIHLSNRSFNGGLALRSSFRSNLADNQRPGPSEPLYKSYITILKQTLAIMLSRPLIYYVPVLVVSASRL